MPKPICLAVDAMGGDFGPEVNVPGSLAAARETGAAIVLVGDEAAIRQELERHPHADVTVDVVHTTQVAGMAEKPSDILRRKKDSSIQVAFRLVRDGQAHGVVTAGNSGAALACGMFILGRIAGVDRPALATILPTLKKPIVLIDVGANADCKPYNLVQFGLMAEVLARYVLDISNPKVGILSIGEEEGKGNALTVSAKTGEGTGKTRTAAPAGRTHTLSLKPFSFPKFPHISISFILIKSFRVGRYFLRTFRLIITL